MLGSIPGREVFFRQAIALATGLPSRTHTRSKKLFKEGLKKSFGLRPCAFEATPVVDHVPWRNEYPLPG